MVILLIVNLICAVGVFVYGIFQPRGRRATVFIFAGLMFLCPPVMALFALISRIMDYFLLQSEVDMNDISFDKSRENVVIQPDSEAEMNYVSIHDATRLSDSRQLRHLLIDVLKYKRGGALSSMYGAMESEDTEASHYAASAVQDALSDFRLAVQQKIQKLRQSPDDVKLNIDTLEYLYEQLKLGLLMDSERATYASVANEAAENLYRRNVWFMLAEHYRWMVEINILVNDLEEAAHWTRRAVKYRRDELDTYKAELNLYYASGDSAAFSRCLEAFKGSDIQADQEMLRLIRLYGGQRREG